MLKGGYEIIDLKGVNISSSLGGHVDGIYDIIESRANNGKANLVSGIYYDDERVDDFYATFTQRESIYYALISFENGVAKYLKVESDDDVSIIEESVSGGGGGAEIPVIDLSDVIFGTVDPNFPNKVAHVTAVPCVVKINNTSARLLVTNFDKTATSVRLTYLAGTTFNAVSWNSSNNLVNLTQTNIPNGTNILKTVSIINNISEYFPTTTETVTEDIDFNSKLMMLFMAIGIPAMSESQLEGRTEGGFVEVIVSNEPFTSSFAMWKLANSTLEIKGFYVDNPNSAYQHYKVLIYKDTTWKINITTFA